MKTTLIARAITGLIAFPVIVLLQAPSGSANDGGYSGGAFPAEISCVDTASVFPTSIYTQLYTGLNGSVSGFEIRLSYSGEGCSTVLYSSIDLDNGANTKAHQTKNDSAIIL